MRFKCKSVCAVLVLSSICRNEIARSAENGATIMEERIVSGSKVRLVQTVIRSGTADNPERARVKYSFELEGRDSPLHVFEVLNEAVDAPRGPATTQANQPRVAFLDAFIADSSNYLLLYKVQSVTKGVAVINGIAAIPSPASPVADVIMRDSDVSGVVSGGFLRGGLGDRAPAALLQVGGKLETFELLREGDKWLWRKR